MRHFWRQSILFLSAILFLFSGLPMSSIANPGEGRESFGPLVPVGPVVEHSRPPSIAQLGLFDSYEEFEDLLRLKLSQLVEMEEKFWNEDWERSSGGYRVYLTGLTAYQFLFWFRDRLFFIYNQLQSIEQEALRKNMQQEWLEVFSEMTPPTLYELQIGPLMSTPEQEQAVRAYYPDREGLRQERSHKLWHVLPFIFSRSIVQPNIREDWLNPFYGPRDPQDTAAMMSMLSSWPQTWWARRRPEALDQESQARQQSRSIRLPLEAENALRHYESYMRSQELAHPNPLADKVEWQSRLSQSLQQAQGLHLMISPIPNDEGRIVWGEFANRNMHTVYEVVNLHGTEVAALQGVLMDRSQVEARALGGASSLAGLALHPRGIIDAHEGEGVSSLKVFYDGEVGWIHGDGSLTPGDLIHQMIGYKLAEIFFPEEVKGSRRKPPERVLDDESFLTSSSSDEHKLVESALRSLFVATGFSNLKTTIILRDLGWLKFLASRHYSFPASGNFVEYFESLHKEGFSSEEIFNVGKMFMPLERGRTLNIEERRSWILRSLHYALAGRQESPRDAVDNLENRANEALRALEPYVESREQLLMLSKMVAFYTPQFVERFYVKNYSWSHGNTHSLADELNVEDIKTLYMWLSDNSMESYSEAEIELILRVINLSIKDELLSEQEAAQSVRDLLFNRPNKEERQVQEQVLRVLYSYKNNTDLYRQNPNFYGALKEALQTEPGRNQRERGQSCKGILSGLWGRRGS